MQTFAMWTPGPTELLVVLLILVLLFGARRLPDLARSIGRSLNEFKKGRAEGEGQADEKPEEEAHGAGEAQDEPKEGGAR